MVGMGAGLSNSVIGLVNPNFTPASIAGCSMWLNPLAGYTTSSGHLTTWGDQQGNVSSGENVGTGITIGTALNGHTAMSFDGTSYLQFSSALSTFISTTAWTFIIVFNYTGANAENGTLYSNSLLFGSRGTYWFHTVSTTKTDTVQYDGAYKNDQATITTSTNYYHFTKYDGTNQYTSINGGAFDAGTATGNATTTDNPLLMGVSTTGSAAGTVYFTGAIADVIAYNVTLSAANLLLLRHWIQGRYGL